MHDSAMHISFIVPLSDGGWAGDARWLAGRADAVGGRVSFVGERPRAGPAAAAPMAGRRRLRAGAMTMMATPPPKTAAPVKMDPQMTSIAQAYAMGKGPDAVGAVRELKLNPYEAAKTTANYARHPLVEDMADGSTYVSSESVGIIKFHGGYLQDHRDQRAKGELKKYQFMLRLKMPAGDCPPEVFRVIDDISEQYGNHTLRLTTRSAYQIHGILKHDLKTVMSAIANAGGGLYGASGDNLRNVIVTPAPIRHPAYECVDHTAKMIAEVLGLQSAAFAEMWLDGEKAATIESWRRDVDMGEVRRIMMHDNGRGQIVPGSEEPIYGEMYLPRKFKIGITLPGDNSIDIYTHDIGLVAMYDEQGARLDGFNVVIGGGMGRTHKKEETFARAADHFGFVPAHAVYDLVKAITAAQRDHGNRAVRTNARMKYLVHRIGVDAFRELVQSYMEHGGSALQPWRELPQWNASDWLGWHEDRAGTWFLGVFVENGRLRQGAAKSALRAIVDRFGYTLRVTPQQNVLVTGVRAQDKAEVERVLHAHGVVADPTQIDPLVRSSMACPALPLCPPAITEAERVMPSYVKRVRSLLGKVGISDRESFVMRMTGCPNGCTRPYMAELAFVGSGPNCTYQVWLGGSPAQTRLAWPYLERVPDKDVEQVLEPIFMMWRARREGPESFGDFCHRVGKDAIAAFAAAYGAGGGA